MQQANVTDLNPRIPLHAARLSMDLNLSIADRSRSTRRHDWSHTQDMRTAVSIPDRLFQAAERTARRLGIPRSRLYARALEEYLRTCGRRAVTEASNKVYSDCEQPEDALATVGLEALREATKDDTW